MDDAGYALAWDSLWPVRPAMISLLFPSPRLSPLLLLPTRRISILTLADGPNFINSFLVGVPTMPAVRLLAPLVPIVLLRAVWDRAKKARGAGVK